MVVYLINSCQQGWLAVLYQTLLKHPWHEHILTVTMIDVHHLSKKTKQLYHVCSQKHSCLCETSCALQASTDTSNDVGVSIQSVTQRQLLTLVRCDNVNASIDRSLIFSICNFQVKQYETLNLLRGQRSLYLCRYTTENLYLWLHLRLVLTCTLYLDTLSG